MSYVRDWVGTEDGVTMQLQDDAAEALTALVREQVKKAERSVVANRVLLKAQDEHLARIAALEAEVKEARTVAQSKWETGIAVVRAESASLIAELEAAITECGQHMCTYCMTAEHTTREHEARAKVNAAAMEVRIAALEAELDELRRGAADRAKKESAAKALADSAVLASEYDVKAANRLQARPDLVVTPRAE